MQKTRDRCLKMMNISEEELKEFSQQQMLNEEDSEESDTLQFQMAKEMMEAQEIINQAREKFEQEE